MDDDRRVSIRERIFLSAAVERVQLKNSDMGEISGCAEIAVYEVALSEPQQSLTQMVKASFLGRGNNITLA